jgi:hypothetical protein
MTKSFVEFKGKTVGSAEGAIYLRIILALVLVTMKIDTSKVGVEY